MRYLNDKIRGCIYGQAIGDALGLATEFMPKIEVRKAYPNGVKDYSDIQTDLHTERWEKGDWTDDTDQMLCILDAILLKGRVDLIEIAKQLRNWYETDALGVGNTVENVVADADFLENPLAVSKKVWIASGRKSAANGGIMRTSILGVWKYQDRAIVEENAKNVCQITHYDPRCVASCVAVCIAIRELLNGISDVEDVINTSIEVAEKYEPGIRAEVTQVTANIEDLQLDEQHSIGYTYKALNAGFWALKYATGFDKGIQDVIMEGGDADTNACVAGSLLGAKFGYEHIPKRLKEGLIYKHELDRKIESFIQKL
ncbi:MAG: ADP-ribosylglycohydrolase family protein [Bacteroidota bacterium]